MDALLMNTFHRVGVPGVSGAVIEFMPSLHSQDGARMSLLHLETT